MKPKWSQNGARPRDTKPLFFRSFSGLVFSACQGPPRDPKSTILAPKMTPKASKMVTERPQQTPKMQHKRRMLKSRTRIWQGHSKEDLRQKGAAAVFRAACSIRRSTAGRVKYTDLYLSVFCDL